MNYNVVTRPKLPRNKYGDTNNGSGSSGTVYFSNNSSSSSSGSSSSSTNINDFVGSTETEDGIRGLVPAPESNYYEVSGTLNDNVKFLKGNGVWTDIPISRYTSENANKDGINLTGNLSVSDTLTTQTLNVTGSAHFWELIIDKVRSTNGNLLITPANFVVDYVGDDITYDVDVNETPYLEYFYDDDETTGIEGLEDLFRSAGITSMTATRVYMKNDDGTHQTVNDFIIGDMVRCKTFNLDDGTTTQNKDYWSMVLNVGIEDYNEESCKYIDIFKSYTDGTNTYTLGSTISDDEVQGITEFTFGYGELNIEEGDNIVSLGHLWYNERQSAILIAACDPLDTELSAPAIAQYEGINEFTNLSKFRTTSIAANGNDFTGRFKVDYNGNYIDINERLNIFSADLTTGLETVGIHLDGENSTIKLVGSVEIRQNSDGSTDTLTVYDSDDIVRVQISPDEIPAKSQISSNINPTTELSFGSRSGQSVPTSATVTEHHTWKEFLGAKWNHQYEYYLSNSYYTLTSTESLGTFSSGDKISISNIYGNFSSKAYFKGSTYTSSRGTAGTNQYFSSIILYLQRYNGSSWVNVTSSNITESSTISIADEYASFEYSGTLLDNYEISTTGTYRYKIIMTYYIYAYVKYSSKQADPYFMFSYTFRSGFTLTQPSAAMTRIGSNGILYNTASVNQYFYSGNDGIEAKWGDVGFTLDNNGYIQHIKVYTVSNSGTSNSPYVYSIPIDADLLIITGTYVKLTYSNSNNDGKLLTVFGNNTTTYNTNIFNMSSETITIQSYDYDSNPVYTDYYLSKTRRKFIAYNQIMYEI